MKKIILASACILALSVGGALAQTNQPAPGASGQGEAGPGTTTQHSNMKKGTTTGSSGMHSSKNMTNESTHKKTHKSTQY
jgi:hypothetical protein